MPAVIMNDYLMAGEFSPADGGVVLYAALF